MHSVYLGFAAAGLATFAQAYTKPTTATWGPLLTPDLSSPVTQGETAKVTWDPETRNTQGVTVSLVLCHGPSSNCVPFDDAIVEGLPAAQKSYDWAVPKDLAPGTQATETGYGMLIIVDGTGEFQYSTQFSVLAGKGGSDSGSKPTSSNTGVVLPPPATYTGSDWPTSTVNATFGGIKTDITVTASATSLGPGPFFTPSGSGVVGTSTVDPRFSSSTAPTGSATVSGTGAGARTSTSSSPGATVSTFEGAAGRLSLNLAGALLAVAAAMLLV